MISCRCNTLASLGLPPPRRTYAWDGKQSVISARRLIPEQSGFPHNRLCFVAGRPLVFLFYLIWSFKQAGGARGRQPMRGPTTLEWQNNTRYAAQGHGNWARGCRSFPLGLQDYPSVPGAKGGISSSKTFPDKWRRVGNIAARPANSVSLKIWVEAFGRAVGSE